MVSADHGQTKLRANCAASKTIYNRHIKITLPLSQKAVGEACQAHAEVPLMEHVTAIRSAAQKGEFGG